MGCFCSGRGKSERLKASIFSNKSGAMVSLYSDAGEVVGSGFVMHKNLLLTTHVNLPSASAAEFTQIRLQNGVVANLVPQRLFITSSVLDLTIIGLDSTEGDSSSLGHHLKTHSNSNLDLGSVVYVLGYTTHKELTIGEGKVVIATDNLIKLSPDGLNWSPGSAGFDSQGNLAFMICDPMKLAACPYTNSSPCSRKDRDTLFGIPMPIISGWLNQHLEPKETLIRSLSRPEHPSLITNQMFNDLSSSKSNVITTRSHDDELKAVAAESCKNPEVITIPSLITLLDIESDPSVHEVRSAGVKNEDEQSPARAADEMEGANSAETAESRSNSSPKQGSFRESVRRGQKGNKSSVEKRSGLAQPRKSVFQGTTSRSTTVSSVKKKMKGELEKPKPAVRIRQTVASSSPRWVF